MSVDDIDERILNILVKDGRVSYREISEKVDVTPPTVKSRIDSLVNDGIIDGFTTVVNKEKIAGEPMINAVVTIRTTGDQVENVFSEVKDRDEAEEVRMTSDSEVHAELMTNQEGITEFLSSLPSDVTSYKTQLIVEKENKNSI